MRQLSIRQKIEISRFIVGRKDGKFKDFKILLRFKNKIIQN